MKLDIVQNEINPFNSPVNKPASGKIVPEEGAFKTGRPAGIPITPESGTFDKQTANQKSGRVGGTKGKR